MVAKLTVCGLAMVLLTNACAQPAKNVPPASEDPSSSLTESFTDITDESGVSFVHVADPIGNFWLPEQMGSGGAALDFDNDGDMDLYLVQTGLLSHPRNPVSNRLYRNEGMLRFLDVTTATTSGATDGATGYGMGGSAADYDADGDVDLYVTRVGANVLLRNNGDGSFSDVTTEAGVGDTSFGASATFLDYDRDGHLDLYVVNYVDWAAQREGSCFDVFGLPDYCSPIVYEAPAVDRLYRGGPRHTFDDVSSESGVDRAAGNGLGVVSTDFDGDGWVDLFVANDQTPGFLWLNQRDGTLLEDASLRGCAFNADGMAIAGMGVVSEDLDGDQDLDLVITNIISQPHLGLRNEGTHFTDATHLWGLAGWGVPRTAFGVGLFDQDLDGQLDGLVANGAVNRLSEPYAEGYDYEERNQFIRRDAAGRFFDATAEAPLALDHLAMSRALLLGDFDSDGDPDAVVTNNRSSARVLRNENRSGHSWLVLDLVGIGGRRDTFNSRVQIHAAGKTFLREVRSAQGFLGSNDPRLFFGLGSADRIDRVEIRWTDGSRQVLEGLSVNHTLRIQQQARP
jgi:hypothetical protein